MTDCLAGFTLVAQDANLAQQVDNWLDSEPDTAERIARAARQMPKVGDSFLGFRLVEELGHGAFGSVFLATQAELAGRPVALKISANLTGEPQKLAQLQHTNIVPVYSIHSSGPLQAVAMPYFGSTTLAHVISQLRPAEKPLPSSGRYVLSTLQPARSTDVPSSGDTSPGAPSSAPAAPAPARPPSIRISAQSNAVLEMFAHMSYVDAILWIVARIAGGLAHAHERGILHRDLKPANILLTNEGQPMLLDFNLAEEIKLRGAATRAQLGGTLPYMAPEQLAVMRGEPELRGIEPPLIDERSDLYALGIILFELLTGRFPFAPVRRASPTILEDMLAERQQAPPSPRRFNPDVSPAAAAIVCKLLQSDPNLRYRKAQDLQEDIDRHLENLPLKHAAEPSPRERAAKLRRRHPRLVTGLLVGLTALVFLIAPATALVVRMKESAENQRRLDTAEAQRLLAQTEDEYRDAQAKLTSRGDWKLLVPGLAAAQVILDRYAIGQNESWSGQMNVARLTQSEQERLREIIGELLVLRARAEQQLAEATKVNDPAGAASHQLAALHWNRYAEHFFADREDPPWLWKQRAELLRLAGNDLEAASSQNTFGNKIASTDFAQYMEASDLALDGSYEKALERVEPVTARNPTYFAAWFLQGMCFSALNRPNEAAESFSICVALQRRSPDAFHNRGLIRLRQNDDRRAEADFTQALQLQPERTTALLDRAIARMKQRKYAEAERDVTDVISRSDSPTRSYFLRAVIRQRMGNVAGAQSDDAEGMKRTPNDSVSWVTRGYHRMPQDPGGALADFEKALEENPHSVDALLNKANVLVERLNQPEAAVKTYDRLVAVAPEDLNARGSRGVVLARIGRVEDARRDAEFCIQRSQSAFVSFQVAGILAQISRHTHAKEDRGRALKLLAMSIRKGFDRLDEVAKDPDLGPIRDDPEYRRLAELACSLMKESPAPK
jgi:serine/threonine protein kinase/Tfp pilus assembly protein PilF